MLSEFDKSVIQEHVDNCTHGECEACVEWREAGFKKRHRMTDKERQNMNTEEVCAMIDAITEGKPFTLNIGTGVNFEFGPNGVSLIADEIGVLARFTDARPSRELAGALIAWANRKDGFTPPPKNDMTELELKNIQRDTFATHEKFLSAFATKSDENQVRTWVWREEWHRRNVGRMTPETRDRNLKDLVEIQAELHPNDPQQADLAAAIEILRENGAK